MPDPFPLEAKRFSAMTALNLARLSDLAYRSKDEVYAFLSDVGLQMKWFESQATDTQGFIAWNDKVTVVVFRGTAGKRDWLTDIDAKLIPYLDDPRLGRIHRGFAASWDSVSDEIFVHVAKHCPAKDILVTGHSLGGALAVICADLMAGLGYPGGLTRLYTFGQPRVFDTVAMTAMKIRVGGYHRYVNNNDVVPRIPFSGWGFRHGGRLNHLDHTGRLLLDPAPWMVLCDRILGRIKDFGKPGTDGIKDHSMGGYVAIVEQLAQPAS